LREASQHWPGTFDDPGLSGNEVEQLSKGGCVRAAKDWSGEVAASVLVVQHGAPRAASRRDGAGADVDGAAAQSGQDAVLARQRVEHGLVVHERGDDEIRSGCGLASRARGLLPQPQRRPLLGGCPVVDREPAT
jgi:hypothetical protein